MKGAAQGLHIDIENMIEFAEDGIVSKTLVFNPQIEFSRNNTCDTGRWDSDFAQRDLSCKT